MILTQQMQYSASNRMWVFQKLAGCDTPNPLLVQWPRTGPLPSKILAARLWYIQPDDQYISTSFDIASLQRRLVVTVKTGTRDGQRDCFRLIYSIKVCNNPRSYDQLDNNCRAAGTLLETFGDRSNEIEPRTAPGHRTSITLRQKWSTFYTYSKPVQKSQTDSDRRFGVSRQQHVVTSFMVDGISSIAGTSRIHVVYIQRRRHVQMVG